MAEGSLLGGAGLDEGGMNGEAPSAEMLARYPSLRPDGEFGPLKRRPAPAAVSGIHPERLASHQEAVRQAKDAEARLAARYPSLQNQRRQMEPVPGLDPQSFEGRFYRQSMPGGSAEPPKPQPPPPPAAVKPAPAPAEQPAAAPATRPETAAENAPDAAPAELPEAYRDLAVEGLEVDTQALTTVAPDLQRLGVSREQAQGLVAVLHKLEARTDADLAAVDANWRREAERLPPAVLAEARSALRGAPSELLRVIEASRIGNHPEVIAWFARLRSGGR